VARNDRALVGNPVRILRYLLPRLAQFACKFHRASRGADWLRPYDFLRSIKGSAQVRCSTEVGSVSWLPRHGSEGYGP
jgi:hypothetical protein